MNEIVANGLLKDFFVFCLVLFDVTSAALLHNVSRQSQRSDLSSRLPAVAKKETSACVCACVHVHVCVCLKRLLNLWSSTVPFSLLDMRKRNEVAAGQKLRVPPGREKRLEAQKPVRELKEETEGRQRQVKSEREGESWGVFRPEAPLNLMFNINHHYVISVAGGELGRQGGLSLSNEIIFKHQQMLVFLGCFFFPFPFADLTEFPGCYSAGRTDGHRAKDDGRGEFETPQTFLPLIWVKDYKLAVARRRAKHLPLCAFASVTQRCFRSAFITLPAGFLASSDRSYSGGSAVTWGTPM